MNQVAELQDKPDNLQRLAAQRQLYDDAKCWLAVVILGPVALAIVGIWIPSFPPGSAIPSVYAFVVMGFSFLEYVLFANFIDKRQEEAALIQELFDCSILELPWNSLLGDKPESRVVHRAAEQHVRGKTGDGYQSLRRWYEEQTPDPSTPLSLARLQCQGMNIGWDSAQRRAYAFGLLMVMIIVSGLFLTIAMAADLNLRQLVVGPALVVPTILLVAGKHYREHRKAADNLDRLKGLLAALQAEANASPEAPGLLIKARDLQTEIFHHRKDGPPVFTWFYAWFKQNR